MKRTLITNIGMLATPQGTSARGGRAQGEICILKNAWILIENDLIAQVGTGAAPAAADAQTINAGGKLVTPGLVDAHTHLIFGGWRQNELVLKLHGAGYLDILAAGGGILSTMRATQSASEEQLEAKASAALDEMLRFGTTTAEAKSGYGLSTGEECKALRVIGKLQKHHVMDLAATFMGAHAVPEAYRDNRQGYLELLCEEMLPAVWEQGIAEFCDVFCEKGVFSAEESRRILLAGRQQRLDAVAHISRRVVAGHGKGNEFLVHILNCSFKFDLQFWRTGGRRMEICVLIIAFSILKSYARPQISRIFRTVRCNVVFFCARRHGFVVYW